MVEGAFKKQKPPKPKPPEEQAPLVPKKTAPRREEQKPVEHPKPARIPKPIPLISGVSYESGKQLTVRMEQANPFAISATNGPVVNGTARAAMILPPFARIVTNGSNFNIGGASNNEFYIGSVQVKNAGNTAVETTYETAIVMKQSPSSNRFVVIPFDSPQAVAQAKATFQNGVPMGVNLEMSQDFMISPSYGPVVGGKRQAVTISAPYVEVVSGDSSKGFSAGGAHNDSFFFGRVKVGDTVYDNAIVMKESLTSDYYKVIPVTSP